MAQALQSYSCLDCEHYAEETCPINYFYDAYLTGAECPCKKKVVPQKRKPKRPSRLWQLFFAPLVFAVFMLGWVLRIVGEKHYTPKLAVAGSPCLTALQQKEEACIAGH